MRPVVVNESELRKKWGRSIWSPLWIVAGEWAVERQLIPWLDWGGVVLHAWCPAWFLRGEYHVDTFLALNSRCPMRRKAKPHEPAERRAAEDEDLKERLPILFDYLTATCYESDVNQPRLVSTLTIFAQDGVWKAVLRDRAENCCLWVASPGLLGLLDVLEAELRGETAVWRLDRYSGAEQASRKPSGKGSRRPEVG